MTTRTTVPREGAQSMEPPVNTPSRPVDANQWQLLTTMSQRLKYLAWFIASGSEEGAAQSLAVMGRARLVKVRWTGDERWSNVNWLIITMGNCQSCAFAEWASRESCTNPVISGGEYWAYRGRDDCPGFAPGQFAGGADGERLRRDLAGSRKFAVMSAIGLRPVIRGDGGILSPSIAGPTPPLSILQSLPYTPWGFYLTAMQEQSFLQISRDYGSREQVDYDPWTDLGDIDPSPPTPEERKAVRADVAKYRDGTLRMPPYAHR